MRLLFQLSRKKSHKTRTGDLGNISASSFLYRLTGWRDLDLKAGQQTHMFPHAGKIFREMTPISCNSKNQSKMWPNSEQTKLKYPNKKPKINQQKNKSPNNYSTKKERASNNRKPKWKHIETENIHTINSYNTNMSSFSNFKMKNTNKRKPNHQERNKQSRINHTHTL